MLIPMPDDHRILPVRARVRHALAFRLYLLALLLSFSGDLIGSLAALIAGDDGFTP